MIEQQQDQWVFRLYRPEAKRVYLVGDFNQWSTTAVRMEPTVRGDWTAVLHLKPGVYRFRYHVDGHWLTDFAAFGIERNPMGHWDSVLYVPDDRVGVPEPSDRVMMSGGI